MVQMRMCDARLKTGRCARPLSTRLAWKQLKRWVDGNETASRGQICAIAWGARCNDVQSGGLTGSGPGGQWAVPPLGRVWEVYEIRGLRRDVMALSEEGSRRRVARSVLLVGTVFGLWFRV